MSNNTNTFRVHMPAPARRLLPEGIYLYTVSEIHCDTVTDPETHEQTSRARLTLNVPLVTDSVDVTTWLYYDVPSDRDTEEIRKIKSKRAARLYAFFASVGFVTPPKDLDCEVTDTLGARGRACFSSGMKGNGEMDNWVLRYLPYDAGMLGPFEKPVPQQPVPPVPASIAPQPTNPVLQQPVLQQPVPPVPASITPQQTNPVLQQPVPQQSVTPVPASIAPQQTNPVPQQSASQPTNPVPPQQLTIPIPQSPAMPPVPQQPVPQPTPEITGTVVLDGVTYLKQKSAGGQMLLIPAGSAALTPSGFTRVETPEDCPF